MSEYINELQEKLNRKYPHLALSIFDSPRHYDDLMRDSAKKYDFHNDHFIIIFDKTDSCITLDAISLYLPSFTLKIEIPNESYEPIPIETIDADVKNYLYAKILQQQTWLFQRISENTWHLASGLSHQAIIQHVVDGALKTIPFSDAVIFRIYEEDQNRLRPVAVSGFKDNYYDYSVSPHESISGKVFESRQSIILNSKDDIVASFKNFSAVRQSVMENNPIANSLICVPVVDQHHCYGTLTILSLDRSSVFNSLAVSLLETFASQVALSWKNAKQYDEKVESFNQVNALKQQLELQNEMLKSSLEFHSEMIELSIKNSDIGSFIAAISAKINIDIGYVDISGEMHGKLNGIEEIWLTLTASKIHETSSEDGFIVGDFFVTPMVNNQQAVGFVVVKNADISDFTRVMLSRLSDFLIMDIMKKVSSLLIENKRKSLIMQRVIFNGVNADTITTLSENGFLIQGWIGCAVLSIANDSGGSEDVKMLDMHNKLKSMLVRSNHFIYYDETKFMIYLSDNSPEKVNQSFIKFEKELTHPGSYQIGLSNIMPASKIKQSLDQASTSLAVLKNRKKEGALRFNKTGIERLFVNHEKEEIQHFISDVLSPLIDGTEKNQVLLKTLNAYIKQGCSVNNTATFLDIHPNTLYQRIKKIESLIKKELSSPDDFLIISVACHMFCLS